jgi:hypothetical protein
MPGMTAATTTPLQSKFGPIVADAAGTITVQEASDVLDCSRFRVCELLNASAGRVLVTDVLALKSLVPPSALEAAPLPSSSAKAARRGRTRGVGELRGEPFAGDGAGDGAGQRRRRHHGPRTPTQKDLAPDASDALDRHLTTLQPGQKKSA